MKTKLEKLLTTAGLLRRGWVAISNLDQALDLIEAEMAVAAKISENPILKKLIQELIARHRSKGFRVVDANHLVAELIPPNAIIQNIGPNCSGNDFITGFEMASTYSQLHMVSFPEIEVWCLLDGPGVQEFEKRVREQLSLAEIEYRRP